MCFHVNPKTSEITAEQHYKKLAIKNKIKENTLFHLSAFDYPELSLLKMNQDKELIFQSMYWGLIPQWAESFQSFSRMNTINARIETLNSKSSFKHCINSQRALLTVSGFYEWQHVGKEKIPFYIFPKDNSLWSLACLYDEFIDKDTNETYPSFSILTKEAIEPIATIHNSKKRMPLILKEEHFDAWLSLDHQFKELNATKMSVSESEIDYYPISANPKTKDSNNIWIEKKTIDKSLQIQLF